MVRPDWFRDPVTGRRSDPDTLRVPHRPPVEEQVGNVKQVWELSRHHHLTVLADGLVPDPATSAYARRVADQLRSWWRENPFLSGVHWTSGIELGIRLISLAWIRRLLDDWPGVGDLFEHDALAVRQIRWHQQYLAAFPSRGSSANNHVIAEAAGQLVASCAFPWFRESERWRRKSALAAGAGAVRNTFPSGIGRELASDYHCFVAELGFARRRRGRGERSSAEPGDLGPAGRDGGQRGGHGGRAAAPASAGRRRRGPRAAARRAGAPTAGRRCWPWPTRWSAGWTGGRGRRPTWAASIVGALRRHQAPGRRRPGQRPSRFADAGMTLLRTSAGATRSGAGATAARTGSCRIAAHAHADALSVEVRYAGVDVLADPGTYCYHGEPEWRSYFRSTIAHNTVELDGRSQSSEGGPFLWVRHAQAREIEVIDDGDIARWTAEHDGYCLARPAGHRIAARSCWTGPRAASTSSTRSRAAVTTSAWPSTSAPTSQVELDESCCGPAAGRSAGTPGAARLELPRRAAVEPAPGRDRSHPRLVLSRPGTARSGLHPLGRGRCVPGVPLATRLEFLEIGSVRRGLLLSWGISDARVCQAPEIRAEA